MTVPDPKTPREWALLCVAQWGRSEEFPGHPFPGLVDYIELTIKTAIEQIGKERDGLALCAKGCARRYSEIADRLEAAEKERDAILARMDDVRRNAEEYARRAQHDADTSAIEASAADFACGALRAKLDASERRRGRLREALAKIATKIGEPYVVAGVALMEDDRDGA